MSTDFEWAHSLVGRDWEIFWDNAQDSAVSDGGVDEVVDTNGALTPPDANHKPVLLHGLMTEAEFVNVNRHLPPLMPGEYDAVVPTTTSGLLLNVMTRNNCIAFNGYNRFTDGSMGPAEWNQCIRNVGDLFVAINGKNVMGKEFGDVIEILRDCAKNSYVVLRLQTSSPEIQNVMAARVENQPEIKLERGASSSVEHDSLKRAQETIPPFTSANHTSDLEEDIIDWYDGRVISLVSTDSGYSFDIQFVGEPHVYKMNLNRSLVRPSARAWLIRARALLCGQVDNDWEKALPPDTATLEDQLHLQYLRQSLLQQNESVTSYWQGDVPSFHYNQVRNLQYFVRAQIYLRSKLAPIVDIGEQSQDDEPTEANVSHLVSCLECVDVACEWYNKCWKLKQQIFNSTTLSTLIDSDLLRERYIEVGCLVLRNLSCIDTEKFGRNKHVSTPCRGSRRTKRRRIRRDLDSSSLFKPGNIFIDDDNNFLDDLGDEQHFSTRAVERFVRKARSELGKWFETYAIDMLANISSSVQAPVENWIRTAGRVLGERRDVEDEQSSSGTSVEDREVDSGGDKEYEIEQGDAAVYSYQNVKEVLDRVTSDVVLSRIDLSKWTSRLLAKLRMIDEFETEAWRLVSKLADETTTFHESDLVLVGLDKLISEVESDTSQLRNVQPLGKSRCSEMTKVVLDDAYAIRKCIVDLWRAERLRERVAFIHDVVARVPNLPHIPHIPGEPNGDETLTSKLEAVFAKAQSVSSKLFSNAHTISKYERDLAQSTLPQTDFTGLRTLQGVGKALSALALLPVLTLVEEKLAVRQDLLMWVVEVKTSFHNAVESKVFAEYERHHKNLMKILGGTATTRKKLIHTVSRSEIIEKEIRLFAKTDFDNLARDVGPTLQASFLAAAAWKERADVIVAALRIHGNPTAGEPLLSTRSIAMVDFKRMDDLLHDYHTFDVSLPEMYKVIHGVHSEATLWSQRITAIVDHEQDLLGGISKCRDERPRGVIVDPARHTLDAVVDLLDWYEKVKQNTHPIQREINTFGYCDLPPIYSLILDGLEVVERYIAFKTIDDHFGLDREKYFAFLTRTSQSTKPSKVINVSKLELTPLGQRILSRLFSDSFDAAGGFPLLSILHVLWVARVSNFVHSATAEAERTRPSLRDALILYSMEPHIPRLAGHVTIRRGLENEVPRFLSLIKIGEAIEAEAQQMISPERYTFRGSIMLANEVRDYLVSLKNLQSRYKSPKNGGEGLTLDPEGEKSIDRITKDLSWLVRTLKYPVLHTDNIEMEEIDRLPWSELVNLHERIPSETDEIVGDNPLIAVRVKELHEAAAMWQERVLSLMTLSVRGAKRRHVGSQEGDVDCQEGQTKVSNVQLAELVKDPILKSVAIPIETAVRDVLRKVEEFEKLMHELLGEDFSGTAVDRAPYPVGPSLVGVDGEFHLYRLTGNALFASLKASVAEISLVSAEIAADTPGKEVFDWITQCLFWIESLNDAVTDVSPFGTRDRHVLLVTAGTKVLEVGQHIFLDISDDIKRSLSAQRIGMSTNKLSEKLTVTIAKGGALHSVGGTFIKWCSLIFDWLRYDINKHHEWVERANVIIDDSIQSKEALINLNDITQDELNIAFKNFDDLQLHFENGRDSLVVVPAKLLIDQIGSLVSFYLKWTTTKPHFADSSLSQELARVNRYNNTKVLMQERHKLLDSLLIRRRIESSSSMDPGTLTPAGGDYREKARSKLENKVTKKGMAMMGFKEEAGSDVVSLYYALKAWEIEGAAFSTYREGEKAVSAQYGLKLTSFFDNIEPVKNPSLCARVLTNQVTTEELLEMELAEMTPQGARDRKAKSPVENESKNAVLRAGPAKSTETRRQTVKSLLKMSAANTSQIQIPTNVVSCIEATKESSLPSMPQLNGIVMMDPINGSSGSVQDSEQTGHAGTVPFTTVTRNYSVPPPPPPPLISSSSVRLSLPTGSTSADSGYVVSQSGSKTFTFIITGDDHTSKKHEFQAHFVLDNVSNSNIDGIIKDSIKNKGRLQVTNFNEFVATKMKSGRSSISVIRLSVCGGSGDFKRFYKDYESKQRLAFFELDGGHHLFLVTPKYHSAATVVRDQLVQKHKTYAVLIRKKTNRLY